MGFRVQGLGLGVYKLRVRDARSPCHDEYGERTGDGVGAGSRAQQQALESDEKGVECRV